MNVTSTSSLAGALSRAFDQFQAQAESALGGESGHISPSNAADEAILSQILAVREAEVALAGVGAVLKAQQAGLGTLLDMLA